MLGSVRGVPGDRHSYRDPALRWRLAQSTLDDDPVRFHPGLSILSGPAGSHELRFAPNFVYHALTTTLGARVDDARTKNVAVAAAGKAGDWPKAAGSTNLDALYRRHWAELCGYIVKTFGYGPPEPEDLAQAAFTKFAALDDPAEIRNPRAYLYRTVHNEAIAQRRRESTKTKHAQTVEQVYASNKADEINGERVLLAEERIRIIEGVVEAMPAMKRNVLLLNRFEGLSKAEVARRLNISPTHVKRLLQQAVTECRAAIERAEGRGRE